MKVLKLVNENIMILKYYQHINRINSIAATDTQKKDINEILSKVNSQSSGIYGSEL